MAKGASNRAQNLFGQEGAAAGNLGSRATANYNTLFPFLTGEVDNPQGFGTTALDQMLTKGGEATSGATGAANEAANLNASRTGNTAAVPAIIGQNARSAMQQQSNNVLGIDIKNAMLKQQQQQEGAAGLAGLYGEDVNAALKASGLQNETLGEWTNADKATNADELDWYKAVTGNAANAEKAMAAG